MKDITMKVLGMLLFFLPHLSTAESVIESVCQPASYTEFVRCAENSAADIKISNQRFKAALKLEDTAKQWVNPELDADTLQKSSGQSETNMALLFTFRLGGKRTALIKEAKSEIQKAQAGRDLDFYQARLEIMLSLYRLSHLKNEVQLEEESVSTFSKIVDQFKKRSARSPEQDVSLTVFKMAQADHQLRLTKLKVEENRLYESLTAATGIAKASILKILPPRKQNWPEVPQANPIESSPQMEKASAELKIAQSLREKAESEAWPDIKMGPAIRTIKEKDGAGDTFVGLSLSMPIPVFTQNGGNRAYYSQKMIEAGFVLEQSKRKLKTLRSQLANQYSETIQTLKDSISSKTLDEKHERLEKQFFKGLVSSSLVIEAHRQLFELEERRNASELEALEAYGQLLILDGRFNEVIL